MRAAAASAVPVPASVKPSEEKVTPLASTAVPSVTVPAEPWKKAAFPAPQAVAATGDALADQLAAAAFQVPVPPSVLPGNIPANPIGLFTQPVNGEGGTIKGWELAASLPFEVLWEPLEGFGIQANYSDTKSSVQPLGPGFPDEPLPGLSKYVSNITLYYDRYGFSARVAQRHRSEFVGEVQAFGGDSLDIGLVGSSPATRPAPIRRCRPASTAAATSSIPARVKRD